MLFGPSENGRKRQKKGEKGRFRPISWKGSQTPLKPPFVTPPFAAAQNNILLKIFREVREYFREVSAYFRGVSACFWEVSAYFRGVSEYSRLETSFQNFKSSFEKFGGNYGNRGFTMILIKDPVCNDPFFHSPKNLTSGNAEGSRNPWVRKFHGRLGC